MRRAATTSDCERLADIWHEAWTDAHANIVPAALAVERTRSKLLSRLTKLVSDNEVITIGQPLSGFVVVRGDELYQLMTAREARGQGIAVELLGAACTHVRRANHASIWLHCAVGNERARRFYEKNDFGMIREETVEFPTETGPLPLPCWRMARAL